MEHSLPVLMSYDNTSSNVLLISNNQVVVDEVNENLRERQILEKFLKNLTIMGGTGAWTNHIMIGKMTDLNIWNNALTVEELKAWRNCSKNLNGNVIDWETAEWQTKGIYEEEIDKYEVS